MNSKQMPAEEWPNTRYAWFVVFVLMVLYLFSFVDRMIIALLVTPIKADLNLTDTDIGLLYGLAFALFYTFVGVFIARLADTWNRTRLIGIGVLLWGLATAACGLAGSFAALFAARVAVGIGEAALSPAAYSLISDYFPAQKRPRAMSVYTLGMYLGVGTALIAGGAVVRMVGQAGAIDWPLVGQVQPWQVVFFVVGLPGVFFFLLVQLFLREPVRREASTNKPTLAAFYHYFLERRSLYLKHYFGFSFLVLYSYSFSAWTPAFLMRSFGMSAGEAGLKLGVVILLTAPAGVLLGSVLAQRLRPDHPADASVRVGTIAAISAILPAALFPLVSSPWLALALIGVTQFIISLPFGVAPAALHEVTPNEYRGQVIAVYLFVINIIGLGTGPLLVGLMNDHLFADENAVGYSLVCMAIIFMPLSGFLVSKASGAFRQYAASQCAAPHT